MPAGWPRRLAVATITIGLMMSVLSNSMTNLALPYIAHDLEHLGRKLDLDRQCDPDRARHLAAAGGGAGRHRRLPPRLSLRAGAVLAGLDRLRLRALAALAPARAHLPGAGRCGHHVDPAGAGARDLSAQHAGPRARLQHHRGRDLAGRRPVDRRGAALDHLVADPVRRLCAARHHLLRAVRALPAAHHAYPPAVRRALGRSCRASPSAC